jgi:hypothetical protein
MCFLASTKHSFVIGWQLIQIVFCTVQVLFDHPLDSEPPCPSAILFFVDREKNLIALGVF